MNDIDYKNKTNAMTRDQLLAEAADVLDCARIIDKHGTKPTSHDNAMGAYACGASLLWKAAEITSDMFLNESGEVVTIECDPVPLYKQAGEAFQKSCKYEYAAEMYKRANMFDEEAEMIEMYHLVNG